MKKINRDMIIIEEWNIRGRDERGSIKKMIAYIILLFCQITRSA